MKYRPRRSIPKSRRRRIRILMFVPACQRPCTRTILHWPGAICNFQHAWPCPSVQLVKLQGEGGFAQVWQAVFCGRGVAAKKLKTRRDTRSSSLRGVASRGSEAKEKRIRSQSRGKTEGGRCDQPALDILKGKCRSGPEVPGFRPHNHWALEYHTSILFLKEPL